MGPFTHHTGPYEQNQKQTPEDMTSLYSCKRERVREREGPEKEDGEWTTCLSSAYPGLAAAAVVALSHHPSSGVGDVGDTKQGGGHPKSPFQSCSHSHDGIVGFGWLYFTEYCHLQQPADWVSLVPFFFFFFFLRVLYLSDPPVHPVNVVCMCLGVCGCLTPCHRFASAIPRHCLSFDIHISPPRDLAPQRELQRHKSFFIILFFDSFFFFLSPIPR